MEVFGFPFLAVGVFIFPVSEFLAVGTLIPSQWCPSFFVLESLVVSMGAFLEGVVIPRLQTGELPFVSFFGLPPFWQLDPDLQKLCS